MCLHTVLDSNKAFDTVDYVKVFTIETELVFICNTTHKRGNNTMGSAQTFKVTNGVKQGRSCPNV